MAWEEMSWAYVAGFFDGEGSIRAEEKLQNDGRNPYRRFRLCFYQNDRRVLEEIQTFLLSNRIPSRLTAVRTRAHQLEIDGVVNVYRTLMQLERYLIVKYDQALSAISRLEELMEQAIDGQLGSHRANSTYAALKEAM